MPNDEMMPYHLYALSTDRRAVKVVARERFGRVTPYYALIYTKADKPEGAIEISEAEAKKLSDEDERWLIDCAVAILAEEIEKHKPEIFDLLSDRINELESELKRRKEEIEHKGGMTDRG